MSNENRPPIFRLTPEERKALLARAEEARTNSRLAAARCALLLSAAEIRMKDTEAMLQISREISGQLEQSIRAYTKVLRQFETPPEQTLLLIKEAVAFEISAHTAATRRLMEDVARWCIDAYYAA